MVKLNKEVDYKIAYADAMYAYSWMENQICELFAALIGCRENIAAKIFFSMDYRRYKVISELIKENHQTHFAAWKKIQKWIADDNNSINSRRNKLAHWRMIPTTVTHSMANPQKGSIELIKMAHGERSLEDNVNIDDVKEFTSDALLLAELINQFSCCMFNPDYEKGFEVFLDVKDITKAPDFMERMEEFREQLAHNE